MSKAKRGRKRTTVPNVSQTSGGSNWSSTGKRPSSLPRQYDFTPPDHIPRPQSHQSRGRIMDGTYVDQKAEKIAANYEENLQENLAQLEGETSSISDGTSRPRELTTEEYTTIFLQSTEKDSRGVIYGVESLKDTVNGLTLKRKQHEESTSFTALQEQLNEAQRAVAEQKNKLHQLSLVEDYLRQTDPAFLDFIAAHAAPATTPTDPVPASTLPAS